MADRLLQLDPDRLKGDLIFADGEIVTTDGLETAVTISLFTDRRAPADATLPDNSGDRRGWCLDYRLGGELGSHLWLLSREKQLSSVLVRAKDYAEAALAWLVTKKIAASVTVTAEVVSPGMLGLLVEIKRRDGTVWSDTFNYYWNAHVA